MKNAFCFPIEGEKSEKKKKDKTAKNSWRFSFKGIVVSAKFIILVISDVKLLNGGSCSLFNIISINNKSIAD